MDTSARSGPTRAAADGPAEATVHEHRPATAPRARPRAAARTPGPAAGSEAVGGAGDALDELLRAPAAPVDAAAAATLHAPQTGTLLALEEGRPVVRCTGPDRVLRARRTVDLHGAHVGREVLLVFERGDPARPIVVGVLDDVSGAALAGEAPGQVEVDADGHRLVIGAREQLVLRCGKASLTLTKTGQVLIEGTYVLSRSTGPNRIKGGSVQLN